MRYDISYLTIFFSKWLRIHTHTCIYRQIHTAYIQIWQWYRQMHADTAVAVSSQPSGLSQALNLGGALIPRAGGPRATRRPRPGHRRRTVSDSDWRVRGHTSPQWQRSALQWSTDCRAAGGQCRSDVWNLPGGPATLRNQTRTQFPARRGRAAHWQDSSQVSILGHSRWLASETRIIPSSVMIHGDLLGSFRWIITTWPVTAGPRDTWKSAARWSR